MIGVFLFLFGSKVYAATIKWNQITDDFKNDFKDVKAYEFVADDKSL